MTQEIQKIVLDLYYEGKEAVSDKSPENIHRYIIKNCPENLRYIKTKQPKDVFKRATDKLVQELRAIQTWNEKAVE